MKKLSNLSQILLLSLIASLKRDGFRTLDIALDFDALPFEIVKNFSVLGFSVEQYYQDPTSQSDVTTCTSIILEDNTLPCVIEYVFKWNKWTIFRVHTSKHPLH